jgi:hypothetical protein
MKPFGEMSEFEQGKLANAQLQAVKAAIPGDAGFMGIK